ncbi:hypothetical protein LCGC14_2625770, partial [marine sediment metagenome]
GMSNLVDYMTDSGFFEAPASSRFHGNYEGGLAKHSFDREIYQVAYVLLTLERLKTKDFIEGGYEVKVDELKTIIATGEQLGLPKPTTEETKEIVALLQDSLKKETT